MMADEQTIGTHRLRIEGDTVLTRWIGTPEYEDVRTIHKHLDQVLAEHGRLFVINDMRKSGLPSAQTRKWIATWASEQPVACVVVNFGASLPIRVLQALILRASALLGNRKMTEIAQCGSEAEAFAWIAAHRRELR